MFLAHLRNELLKLFGKKRTYIGFGTFLIAQNAMLLAFRFTRWQGEVERALSGNGYLAVEFISALTVAMFMLIPQLVLLMPLYTSLVGGDLVAKEAEDGTLRMILCNQVAAERLLLAKWFAGLIFCALLVLTLGATALFFARLWFPWKGMFVFSPPLGLFSVLPPADGLRLYVFSHVFMIVSVCVVFALGFMFSCFNMKPAAATILALSFLFVNLVMEGIPFFERYHEYLLPYHLRAYLYVFAHPIPWNRILGSGCILVAVCVSSFLIGAAAFQARDIKS